MDINDLEMGYAYASLLICTTNVFRCLKLVTKNALVTLNSNKWCFANLLHNS